MKKFLFLCIITLLSTLQLFAQPIISSFSPTKGSVGTVVTIYGSNFSTTPSDNLVYFGPVRASVTVATSTSLTVTVPSGASCQPITVITGNLVAHSDAPFILTFVGGGSVTNHSFLDTYPLDSALTGTFDIRGLDINDLDGDGKPDVAVVDRANNIVSIYRNRTTGNAIALDNKVNLNTGALPMYVTSGDLDGDGKADLIVANSDINTNTVSIYKNTSSPNTISFAAPQNIDAGTQPTAIFVIDFDKDGKEDIAIANIEIPGTITLLRNVTSNGIISFAAKQTIGVTGSFNDVKAADLDGDKLPDLIVSNYTMNSIAVLKNNSTIGNLSFASPQSFATGSFPSGIAIGDLDADGKVDLAVANSFSNTLSIFKNTSVIGTISLSAKPEISSLDTPTDVTMSDIDGDGKLDVLVSDANSSSTFAVTVLKNTSITGNILLNAGIDYPIIGHDKILAADMDLDGRQDIVVSGSAFAGTIYQNRIGAPDITSFTPTSARAGDTVTITGVGFNGVTSVSFGHVDAASFNVVNATTITAVVSSGGASGDVEVTAAKGSSVLAGFVFLVPPTISSFTPTSGTAGAKVTITGTNLLDANSVSFGGTAAASFTILNATTIIATIANGSSGDVRVTTAAGNTSLSGFTFNAPPSITSFSPVSGGPGTVVTIYGAHFTGTTAVSFGEVPVVSFTVNSSTVITAVVGPGRSGSVKITSPIAVATLAGFVYLPASPPVIQTFSPASGSIGSSVTITGSGFDSIPGNNIVYFGATKAAVTNSTTTQLTVIVPKGATYQPISVYNKQTYVSGYSSEPFIVTFPEGNIHFTPFSFATKTDFNAGMIVGYTTLCDFDDDGKVDIATGDAPFGLKVMRNNSNTNKLSFSSAITINPYIDPFYGIVTGDIDGDGLPDIAAFDQSSSSYSQGKFSVLRNKSTNGFIDFDNSVDFITGLQSSGIAIGDLDKDGKSDIIVSNAGNRTVAVFRNTSVMGQVSFAKGIDLPTGGYPKNLVITDLDGDGLLDIVVNNGLDGTLSIFKNSSTGKGTLSFATAQSIQLTNGGHGYLTMGDIDGDHKPDLVTTNAYTSNTVSLIRNTSTIGTISFAAEVVYPTVNEALVPYISDLNGDGKLDLALSSGTYGSAISVYKNNSSAGTITLEPAVNYTYPGNAFFGLVIGDVDGDDKPDIVASNGQATISVFANQTDPFIPVTACANMKKTLISDITGTSYQWQVNNGSGFVNLSNNSMYANVNGQSLEILSLTTDYNNYQYRCIVDGTYSKRIILTVDTVPGWPFIDASPYSKVCIGTPVTLTASFSGCTSCNYTWNDTALTTGAKLTVNEGGNYVITAKNICGTTTASKLVTMSPIPNLTIASSAATVCKGNSVQLTASGAATYIWSSAPGLSSTIGETVTVFPSTSTTYKVTGNIDWCYVEKSILVNVTPSVVPSITISNAGCSSTNISFSALITNGGSSPVIKWYVDNVLSDSGSTYTLANATNGKQVYAKLESNAACSTPQVVTSNVMTVNCITTAVPQIDGIETFEILPNPTKGILVIKLKLDRIKKVAFKILDNSGLTIYSTDAIKMSGTLTKQIDLSEAASGIYYLQTTIDGNQFTEKIIIAR